MYGNTSFSMPSASFSQGYESPKQRRPVIFIAIIAAEFIIITILIIILIAQTAGIKAASTDDQEDFDDTVGAIGEGDRKDFNNDDAASAMAVWVAATYNQDLPQSSCQKLAALAKSYVKKYGDLAVMKDSICNEPTIKVAAVPTMSDEYPFSQLRTIYLGNNSNCARFSFYTDFTSLQSYRYDGKTCSVDSRTVNIIKGK